jgi:ribosome-binding factor A
MGRVYRKGRLGEEIRRIVSNMLLKEIKDPRLSGGIVTVSGVEVTEDGSYATIFITKFPKAITVSFMSLISSNVLNCFIFHSPPDKKPCQ